MNSRLLMFFFFLIFPSCFLYYFGEMVKRSGNVMHAHCKCAKKRGITSELYEASFSVAANDFTEKEK